MNINKTKGNVYLRSEFDLGCSADTFFKITANDAITFTWLCNRNIRGKDKRKCNESHVDC